MPPVGRTEDYLDLIAAIEADGRRLCACRSSSRDAARADPRLNHLKVTPDPGVIEVNLQPAHRLGGARRRRRRRCTRRRGRRGWGPRSSCSTAGTPAPAAATTWCSAARQPADSPFLRRPDLLRSLLGYWHNHPSLSYLFSGLFFGPDQPASARRRRPERFAARARDRVRAGARARGSPRRGWWIACFDICSSI